MLGLVRYGVREGVAGIGRGVYGTCYEGDRIDSG